MKYYLAAFFSKVNYVSISKLCSNNLSYCSVIKKNMEREYTGQNMIFL